MFSIDIITTFITPITYPVLFIVSSLTGDGLRLKAGRPEKVNAMKAPLSFGLN